MKNYWSERSGIGVSIVPGALAIFLLFAPLYAQEACLECHGDSGLSEDEETARLYVDPEIFESSIHGFLECSECHMDLIDQDPWGYDPDLADVDCSVCHGEAQELYDGSLHAYARERGNQKAPDCSGCHGAHDILASSEDDARTNRHNVVQMCASCHGTAGLLTDTMVRLPQAVEGYAQSVHGQAFARGIETAAICSDCHGVHNLKGVLDPESLIHPYNVSSTCGRCHNDIQSQYDKSIHGRALSAGIQDSPTCNDCHGEHQVLSPSDPDAATYASELARETCGRCHEDSRVIEKYGLADYVVSTYVDSYHGWAKRWDSVAAANCIDCHTAHWVLPERDPASTVSPVNVVRTCGQCHEEATTEFATSYTHRAASAENNVVTVWIEWIYLILIPVVIGGMLLHNAVILGYFLQRRRQREKAQGTLRLLDKAQIYQHLLLAASFIVLVITGFALRFPDAFWVRPLAEIGMTEEIRSITHRVSAVILLVTGLWHMLYIALSRRGRSEFLAMFPRWRDVSDLNKNIAYHVGARKEHVTFDRYDYTQKAEYWALVWGTIVMGVTGFVLWFPAQAVSWFPSWIVEASEALHYYEAWLATLAILVWHFFFVIFHPEVYPMSWTWITGEMSEKMVREHHGDWYRKEEGLEPSEKT